MAYQFQFQQAQHLAAATSTPKLSGSTWLIGADAKSAGAMGAPLSRPSFMTDDKNAVPKSATEKHANVVDFLNARGGTKYSTYDDIRRGTGVDLEYADAAVKEMLERNPKVEILNDDDPEHDTLFLYFAKYNVRNKRELLALVDRCRSGINRAELHDSYAEAAGDIDNLIRGGALIAQDNKDTRSTYLFPRGAFFLTKVRGTLQAFPGHHMAPCSEPLEEVLKRGEAIRLGDRWCRVSREVVGGAGAQPQRAAVPLSVTTDTEGDTRNVYLRGFTGGDGQPALPLHHAWPHDAPPWAGAGVRHGCSQAVRHMWRETLQDVPRDDGDLQKMMHRAGLITHLKTDQKRVRKFQHGQRRQRNRKKRAPGTGRNLKITNTHLAGTDTGRVLEEAARRPEG